MRSNWAKVDLSRVPHIQVPPPGPKFRALHERCGRHFKGLSSQVKLFLVAFESGYGCTLRDVDGNTYLDFSSGIYVTTLGHCHPKIVEAVQKAAGTLMNCHDFTTEIKTRLVEKLAQVLPGDLKGFHSTTAGRPPLRQVSASAGPAPASTSSFRASTIFTARPTAPFRWPTCARLSMDPPGLPGFIWCPGPIPIGRCGKNRTGRLIPTPTSLFTRSTSTRERPDRLPPSCSNPSRGGGVHHSSRRFHAQIARLLRSPQTPPDGR